MNDHEDDGLVSDVTAEMKSALDFEMCVCVCAFMFVTIVGVVCNL